MTRDGVEPPVFAIDVAQDADGGAVVAVTGELDLARADELTAAVDEALAGGDVTIDLARTTFMDSAGVRALNTALRAAAERGRALRVRAAMQPMVAQVLQLTGMMGLLDVEPDPA